METCILFMFIQVLISYAEIRISENYSNLTVGSTTYIKCDVPKLMPSVVSWNLPTSTSNILTLESVNSTLNGVNFTCTVNSNKLYTPAEKMITVTVKGLICDE